MDENPTSVAGQIIQLYDQGYQDEEILAELKTRPGLGKMTKERVQAAIRQFNSRGMDSRRLFEVYEMVVEILANTRQMLATYEKEKAAKRRRAIEKQLPQRIGAAIDKLTTETQPASLQSQAPPMARRQ